MSTMDDEITRAIGAHGNWKRRLHDAIATGKSEYTAARATADNVCDFGKWLYGLPMNDRTTPDWRKVQQAHAAFHSEAGQVLSAAIGGNKAEAERRMSAAGNFAKVSADLTSAMMTWRAHRR